MKKTILTTIILTLVISVNAQDPYFSNQQQALLTLNPSFAGSNSFIRYQSAYRNQWPSLSGTYVTFYNGADMYLKKINGGLAVNYLFDDQANGTLRTTAVNIIYAHYFYLSERKLKIVPSIQAGAFMKKLDKSKLSFGDPYTQNPRTCPWGNCPEPSSQKNNFDLSAGVLSQYKNLFIGASLFHITEPDEGLYGVSKLPMRFSMHGSYNLNVNDNTLFNFSARYSRQQKFEQVSLKTNVVLMRHAVLGVGLSSYSVINTNIGYRANYFVISLGYDHWYNSLLSNASSWELQASFNLRNKDQRKQLAAMENW